MLFMTGRWSFQLWSGLKSSNVTTLTRGFGWVYMYILFATRNPLVVVSTQLKFPEYEEKRFDLIEHGICNNKIDPCIGKPKYLKSSAFSGSETLLKYKIWLRLDPAKIYFTQSLQYTIFPYAK